MDKIEILEKSARESAERANEISSEYSNNTGSIINKLIVIALGTSSLLFTFLGVLYSTNKEVRDLQFKFILFALIAFIVAAILLLLARYFPSLYRHSMAQKYHLEDKKLVEQEKLNLLNNNQLINSQTGSPFTAQEAESFRAKLNKRVGKIDKFIDQNKEKEKKYHELYRYSFLSGIILLIVGYIMATIFSVDIITVLNR